MKRLMTIGFVVALTAVAVTPAVAERELFISDETYACIARVAPIVEKMRGWGIEDEMILEMIGLGTASTAAIQRLIEEGKVTLDDGSTANSYALPIASCVTYEYCIKGIRWIQTVCCSCGDPRDGGCSGTYRSCYGHIWSTGKFCNDR